MRAIASPRGRIRCRDAQSRPISRAGRQLQEVPRGSRSATVAAQVAAAAQPAKTSNLCRAHYTPRGATALRPETRGTSQIVSAQFLVAAITWRLDGANHLGGPP